MLLLIGLWLTLSACHKSPNLLPDSLDTTRCDPTVRQDCISVSQGFVEERIHNLADLTLIRQQLKACQEKR